MPKQKTDYHLTPERARLVEEHHNLIYSFLRRERLPIDEWYGIVAVGLCKAAAKYDPARGAFSTVAYQWMLGELRHELRDRNRHAPSALSLDEPISPDANVTLGDLIDKQEDPQDIAVSNIQFRRAVDHAPAQHIQMLRLRSQGLLQQQIAEQFGVTQATVSRCLLQLRAEVVAG